MPFWTTRRLQNTEPCCFRVVATATSRVASRVCQINPWRECQSPHSASERRQLYPEDDSWRAGVLALAWSLTRALPEHPLFRSYQLSHRNWVYTLCFWWSSEQLLVETKLNGGQVFNLGSHESVIKWSAQYIILIFAMRWLQSFPIINISHGNNNSI